jgi:hypothetical protein
LNDGLVTGETAEDRFVGWEYAGGISSIHIRQTGSDMEVDHLQYGLFIPEPKACWMVIAGLLLASSRWRSSRPSPRCAM